VPIKGLMCKLARITSVTCDRPINASVISSNDGFVGGPVASACGGLGTITSMSVGADNKCVGKLIVLRTRRVDGDGMGRPAGGRGRPPRPDRPARSIVSETNLRVKPPKPCSLRQLCCVPPSLHCL